RITIASDVVALPSPSVILSIGSRQSSVYRVCFRSTSQKFLYSLQAENLPKLAGVLVEIEIDLFGNRLELELALIHFRCEGFNIATRGNAAHFADHRLRFG